MRDRQSKIWQVPYLPIDPADIGREYEPIVRINSQSGKGGVAFVMDTYFGFKLPKGMHKEFARVIQQISEVQGEVAPEQIMDAFRKEYLDKKEPLHFKRLKVDDLSGETDSVFDTHVTVTYTLNGVDGTFEAVGSFVNYYVETAEYPNSAFYYYSLGQSKFLKVTKELTYRPYRAFFVVTPKKEEGGATKAPARLSLCLLDGTTTDIDASLVEGMETPVYYDLSGRRVLNPGSGVYIVNGKKVFIK
jgi:hypothetical protein